MSPLQREEKATAITRYIQDKLKSSHYLPSVVDGEHQRVSWFMPPDKGKFSWLLPRTEENDFCSVTTTGLQVPVSFSSEGFSTSRDPTAKHSIFPAQQVPCCAFGSGTRWGCDPQPASHMELSSFQTADTLDHWGSESLIWIYSSVSF